MALLVNAALAWLLVSVPVARADAVRILAFGDSLVAGWGLAEADAFPAQLERALAARGRSVEIIDGGVSGDTSAGGLARLTWTVGGTRPDAVIVELGANDGLRGLDPARTEANLEAVLDGLERRALPVLFTGMLAPPNLGREYRSAFNAVFPRLAAGRDVVFYPFFLDGVAAKPDLNQGDGMHPNAAGVAVIVERILPAVLDLLDRVDVRRSAAAEAGE